MSLVTSCLKRKIRISGSERVFYLKPPTVRQVAEILHVLNHMGDRHDMVLLFELIGDLSWDNKVDQVVHIRNVLSVNKSDFRKFMQDVILQGYNPSQVEPSQSPDEQNKDHSSNYSQIEWARLISDYCRVYPGRDPYQVYNDTPFPFFMEMIPEVKREQARQHVYNATIAGFSFGGDKDLFKTWKKRGFPEEEEFEPIQDYQRDLTQSDVEDNYSAFKQDMRS